MNPRFAPATRMLWHSGVLGALEQVRAAGFHAAEVWAQHLWDAQTAPLDVHRKAGELGLRLSLHAPSYDLNPLSSNPEIRAVSRRQVLESLETADAIGARVLVAHPGQLSSSTDDVDEYWTRLEAYIVDLNAKARALDLWVALEGMEKKRLQFVTNIPALERLAGILERLGSDAERVSLALDIAHAGTMGDPLAFLERVPRVGHAHLSDTSVEKTHALLGEGRLDLGHIVPKLLERIEATPHGLIAIEGRLSSDEPRALRVAAAYLKQF
jgi:sugar phosphate isomerase/epimerase